MRGIGLDVGALDRRGQRADAQTLLEIVRAVGLPGPAGGLEQIRLKMARTSGKTVRSSLKTVRFLSEAVRFFPGTVRKFNLLSHLALGFERWLWLQSASSRSPGSAG